MLAVCPYLLGLFTKTSSLTFHRRAHLNLGLVLFLHRHPECREGSSDRDFSPTAQNDDFLDTPRLVLVFPPRHLERSEG